MAALPRTPRQADAVRVLAAIGVEEARPLAPPPSPAGAHAGTPAGAPSGGPLPPGGALADPAGSGLARLLGRLSYVVSLIMLAGFGYGVFLGGRALYRATRHPAPAPPGGVAPAPAAPTPERAPTAPTEGSPTPAPSSGDAAASAPASGGFFSFFRRTPKPVRVGASAASLGTQSCAPMGLPPSDHVAGIDGAAAVALGTLSVPRDPRVLAQVGARSQVVAGDRVDVFAVGAATMAVRYVGAAATVRTVSVAFQSPRPLCVALQMVGALPKRTAVELFADGRVEADGPPRGSFFRDGRVLVRGSGTGIQAIQLERSR